MDLVAEKNSVSVLWWRWRPLQDGRRLVDHFGVEIARWCWRNILQGLDVQWVWRLAFDLLIERHQEDFILGELHQVGDDVALGLFAVQHRLHVELLRSAAHVAIPDVKPFNILLLGRLLRQDDLPRDSDRGRADGFDARKFNNFVHESILNFFQINIGVRGWRWQQPQCPHAFRNGRRRGHSVRVFCPDQKDVRRVRLQVVDGVRLGGDPVGRHDPSGLEIRAEALDGVADQRRLSCLRIPAPRNGDWRCSPVDNLWLRRWLRKRGGVRRLVEDYVRIFGVFDGQGGGPGRLAALRARRASVEGRVLRGKVWKCFRYNLKTMAVTKARLLG